MYSKLLYVGLLAVLQETRNFSNVSLFHNIHVFFTVSASGSLQDTNLDVLPRTLELNEYNQRLFIQQYRRIDLLLKFNPST